MEAEDGHLYRLIVNNAYLNLNISFEFGVNILPGKFLKTVDSTLRCQFNKYDRPLRAVQYVHKRKSLFIQIPADLEYLVPAWCDFHGGAARKIIQHR